MRKFIISILAIMLIPAAAFAGNVGVRASLFSGAPDFHNGLEYDSSLLYQQEFTGQLRAENQKEFFQNVNEATRALQKQTDENVKWLASAVEKGTLKEIEDKLRKQAEATGAQFSAKTDSNGWSAEYIMKTDYGIRTDTANVYFAERAARIVTTIKPYGVIVFSVAQIRK